MPSAPIDCESLVERYVDDRTLALLLLGSHARGDAGPLSDIDLNRHVAASERHGRLDCYVDVAGRLVTVKTLQPARIAVAMGEPGETVWQVPGLRDAVVLYDKDGGAAALIARARSFTWESLGAAVDRHVAAELARHTEEALKIASGVAAGRASQVLYGTIGMTVGLAEAMVVHRRGFIDSENRLFDIALDAMAGSPQWQDAFRISAGYTSADPQARGRAALTLYGETARLAAAVLSADERRIVGVGLAAASQVLNRSFGLPIS